MARARKAHPPFALGIEGGATRSTLVVVDASGRPVARMSGGPCHFRLQAGAVILRDWRRARRRLGRFPPDAVGAFLAGCCTEGEARQLRALVHAAWPRARIAVGHDTQSALEAGLGRGDGVVVICGTGSILRARRGSREALVGGWGHVGGDTGSAYWMARELLRAVFERHDRLGSVGPLGDATLRFLGFRSPGRLATWSVRAPKDALAALARVVFQERRRPEARRILRAASEALAAQVALAARRVTLVRPAVALNRGLAAHQPSFRRELARAIRHHLPGARVFLSREEGALGAARLALRLVVPPREPPREIFR